MLHGMIPAAFFATLLRRYLDSLSECSQYTPPPSSVGCLGTSAAIATVGMAVYGLSRLSRKKVQLQVTETKEMISPPTPQKKESNLRMNRKPTPRKVTRKRHKKGKKWFMKHMRHYKSKYGRQIGKLMNQFLGVPFAEPAMTEPLDLDGSDEDDCEVDSSEVFDISSYNEDTDDRSAFANRAFNEENKAAPSKEHFDDDYEDMSTKHDIHSDAVRKRNSSLDLKDLLRDNFEMQKKRRNQGRGSSRSRSSSGSDLSRCSEDTLIRHSRSSSKKNILSTKRSRSSCRSRSKISKTRSKNKRLRSTSIPRKTRSGRCYNNSIS